MQKLRAAVSDGCRVEARGEEWLVLRREPFDDCVLVTLRGVGKDNRGYLTRLLTPFDQLTPTSTPTRLVRRSRPSVLRTAARAVAHGHDWLEPWTTLTAKIELIPWQLEPAIAAVAGATRLLLMDDVGLGKTIQAGLILSELRARGLVSRALVLTPASLRLQWQSELQSRFGLDSLVVDSEELARRVGRLPVGVNPWTTAEIVISSIDLVKRAEVRSAVDATPIDILVVDEAHHLTPGSDRGALVADLAARTTWVVLATATPHSGDSEAFAFLSQIGAHSNAPAVSFRRSATDVRTRLPRRVHFHRVTANPLERELLDETLRYTGTLWRLESARAGASILASVICRRATSSSRAFARTLSKRRQLLAGSVEDPASQPALPWLEDEETDGIESDRLLGMSALDTAGEMAWLDRLVALAERVGAGSKLKAIARLLSRIAEPAIVFSEYRDTLVLLEEELSPLFPVAMLHGGLSAAERSDEIQRFVEGNARLLLASDAAGEGLNLHARCRLVVNVELPWNPVRLEQRIGRVDRLGQTRRVHAVHMLLKGSFEERVLARLERRAFAAQRELHDLGLDEGSIAAAVFNDIPPVTRTSASHRKNTDAPVAAARIATVRRAASRLAAGSGRSDRDVGTVCAELAKSGTLANGMALLFTWDIQDGHQRIIGRRVQGVNVRLGRRKRIGRQDIKRCTQLVAACPLVLEATDELRSASLRQAATDVRLTAAAIEARLRSIEAHLNRVRAPMFQGSLFDRRAEQLAQANRQSIDVIRAHVARQLNSVRSLLVPPSATKPRLIAAWALGVE